MGWSMNVILFDRVYTCVNTIQFGQPKNFQIIDFIIRRTTCIPFVKLSTDGDSYVYLLTFNW